MGSIGDGKWGALDAAVRLQHESWRNGVADIANDRETSDAVLAHARLARELDRRNGGFLQRAGYLQDEVRLLTLSESAGDVGLFTRIAGQRYDATEDFWRLVRERDGSHSLEFDARADIYDESLNFLVGTGSTGVQTALSSYLGVSMAEAARIMGQAGMQADATGYWNRDTADANMGKRIGIRESADPLLSSYLFAAYNQNAVMDEIAAVVSGKGQSMSRAEMREYLHSTAPAWQDVGDTYQLRYQALRITLIDFYLGSGSVDQEQGRYRAVLWDVPDESTKSCTHITSGLMSATQSGLSCLLGGLDMVGGSDGAIRIGNVLKSWQGYSFEDKIRFGGFGFGSAHLWTECSDFGSIVRYKLAARA